MPTKQSNVQKQSVRVVVNNRIESKCCDDKKKRKPKRRQPPPPPPEVINEFPALATPPSRANTSIPNISPIAVRNVVYPAQTVQISPEGDAPPIPAYFEVPYTNLVRTMENLRTAILNERRDIETLAQATQTMSPAFNAIDTQTTTPVLGMSSPQGAVNVPPRTIVSSPNPDDVFLPSPPVLQTQKTPVKDLINTFEASSSKASPSYDLRQREEPEPDDIPEDWLTSSAEYQTMSDEEILKRYKKYYPNISYQGRGRKSLIDALIRNAKKTKFSNTSLKYIYRTVSTKRPLPMRKMLLNLSHMRGVTLVAEPVVSQVPRRLAFLPDRPTRRWLSSVSG